MPKGYIHTLIAGAGIGTFILIPHDPFPLRLTPAVLLITMLLSVMHPLVPFGLLVPRCADLAYWPRCYLTAGFTVTHPANVYRLPSLCYILTIG